MSFVDYANAAGKNMIEVIKGTSRKIPSKTTAPMMKTY